jgi:addiction module RelE/StbE family toxin
MMRRVVWVKSARKDFREALEYVKERSPQGAETIVSRIEQALTLLAERLHGRPGRVAGTYEKTITGIPYIIAYELDDRATPPALVVLRVIHAARNWPPGEWPSQ